MLLALHLIPQGLQVTRLLAETGWPETPCEGLPSGSSSMHALLI